MAKQKVSSDGSYDQILTTIHSGDQSFDVGALLCKGRTGKHEKDINDGLHADVYFTTGEMIVVHLVPLGVEQLRALARTFNEAADELDEEAKGHGHKA